MSKWRYIAQRLNGDGTAEFLDFDVPLQDAEIEDVLSAPPGLSGKVTPEVARLVDGDGNPIFREWDTAIFAEKDGEIRGGGILTHSGFNGSEWDIECSGFMSYPKDMPYTGPGVSYVETDTLEIVRAIWGHLQSQDGGNLGLEVDDTLSGVLVGSELASSEYDPEGGPGGLTLQSQAYKLAWWQDHDLAANINGLAEDTPFDYHEEHYWAGEEIAHRLRFGVPTLGVRRNDLRFVIGENVYVKPSIERDGEDFAEEVLVVGAGEGASMVRGQATRARTRLRRVAVYADSSLRTVARANAVANTELRWRSSLDSITSVTVRDTEHAPVGSVDVGDEIHLQGPTGWIEADAWFRVLAIRIKPEVSGAMELTLARSDRLA